MNPSKKLSIKASTFFQNLRKQLQIQKIKVQQVFGKILSLQKQNYINQFQLTKLIKLSQSSFNIMEVTQIFDEMKGELGIPIQQFYTLYYNSIQKKQVDKPKQLEPKCNENQPNQNKTQKKLSLQQKDINQKYKNITQAFPRSHKLCRRLSLPNPEELQHLKRLQSYLKNNTNHKDSQNPQAHEGDYVPSQKIFKDKCHLFMLSQSVGYRQVSRNGIAKEIEPKDVQQGGIGNCYFLSSIASIISYNPQIVDQLFLFDKNPANYYVIRLFIDGEWQYISTDDQFPCQKALQGYRPVFAQPHGQQIWVMLIEKCFAKNDIQQSIKYSINNMDMNIILKVNGKLSGPGSISQVDFFLKLSSYQMILQQSMSGDICIDQSLNVTLKYGLRRKTLSSSQYC